MNAFNIFTPDLTNPICLSDLYSDLFLINNFNQPFDGFLNDSIICTNNNADYNNSNQIPNKPQFDINQNEFNFSSKENFNIFDDEFDAMLLNLDSNVTTSTITTPTSSMLSLNSISPSNTYELTDLMEIPTNQFYTSDVKDLNTIDDIADDSIRLQFDSLSSNSSPNNQSSSSDNYSLSSSLLNSPTSENSDECKVKNRKTATSKKQTNKIQGTNLTERQLRKREQNRQAALRYRLKKKNEAKNIENEEKQLLDDLKNLQNEIREMQKSSECYENLLKEILNMNN